MRHLVFALIFLVSGSSMGASVAQAALSTLPTSLPDFDPNAPYEIGRCTGTLSGRMTSSMVIQTIGVSCQEDHGGFYHLPAGWRSTLLGGDINMGGQCKGPKALRAEMVFTPKCPGFAVTVEFANPPDARKIPLGKLVRL